MNGSFYYSTVGLIRFEYLLSAIAFLIWVKLFMQFRFLKTFGILFIVILKLVLELMKFFVIWLIEIMIFCCVGLLAFG